MQRNWVWEWIEQLNFRLCFKSERKVISVFAFISIRFCFVCECFVSCRFAFWQVIFFTVDVSELSLCDHKKFFLSIREKTEKGETNVRSNCNDSMKCACATDKTIKRCCCWPFHCSLIATTAHVNFRLVIFNSKWEKKLSVHNSLVSECETSDRPKSVQLDVVTKLTD